MKLLSQLLLLGLLPYAAISSALAQQKDTTSWWSCLFSGYEFQLFDAVAAEDTSALDSHIQCGADVNARNANGESPLLVAVSDNSLIIAAYLLSKGANPNAAGSRGQTPLKIAAAAGDLRMIQLLVKNGADVNYGSPTPLDSAASRGHFESVKYLIKKGAHIGYALVESLKNKRYSVAHYLLSQGADINTQYHWKGTVLHLAVESQNTTLLQWAIRNGANVNAINEQGDTPLHKASKIGFIEGIVILAKNPNSDLSIVNKSGMTFREEIQFLHPELVNEMETALDASGTQSEIE